MHIKNTYPSITRGSGSRRRMLAVLRWPFILSALACLIVNVLIGGPLWSIVAVFALYMAWTLIFAIDLVEYNMISQTIKTVVLTSILLALIDILLFSGWAKFVIPIICFSGLLLCAVLFFSNLETHKHNMLPLIDFIVIAVIGSGVALYFWHESGDWPIVVLFCESALFFLSIIVILGQDFVREIKRRFHIK